MWMTTNINRYLNENILDASDTIEYWWLALIVVSGGIALAISIAVGELVKCTCFF